MTSGPVYVGLAASSHDDGPATFYMDNVRIIEYDPNTAPTAVADSYSTNRDAHLNVAPAGGVLVNDTDGQGDPLSAVLVGDVSNGSVELYANGSFGYTPDGNYTGPDSFTYKANDGRRDGNEVAVSITVVPIGDIPGDANIDGLVDIQDFFILKDHFDQTGVTWGDGDFNSDRLVDIQDFFILKDHFDQGAMPGGGAPSAQQTTASSLAADTGSGDALSVLPAGLVAAGQVAAGSTHPGRDVRQDIEPGSGVRPWPPANNAKVSAGASAGVPPRAAGVLLPAGAPATPGRLGEDNPGSLELQLDAVLIDVLGDVQAKMPLMS